MLVAEDWRKPARNHPRLRQASCERMRHPKFLKLAMEPVGEVLVLVAVAEEGVVARAQAQCAAHLCAGMPVRVLVGQHSGKLGHRPPERVPVNPVNTAG